MATVDGSRDSYSVGIICALAIEKAAAEAMLDEEYPPLSAAVGDENDYTFGRIGAHRVVIACLPAGLPGTTSAAVVAKDMMRSFPIRIGLMVGICGGVWSPNVDVRLGDVIVSQPAGQHGGVVQWDFGKTEAGGGFRRTGTLNKPPRALLNAVQSLQTKHIRRGHELDRHVMDMLTNNPAMEEGGFVYQGRENDGLFEATYEHSMGADSCRECAPSRLVHRAERNDQRPKIHHGNIASGNQVLKHGETRDRIARQEDIIGFEMEAAGLMDTFPCVVIRGVCDYADSHKNKRWQPYAAATAAAYTKELLLEMPVRDVAGILTAKETSGETSTRHAEADVSMAAPASRVVHIPFPKNYQFVGRRSELQILKRRLFEDQDCDKMAVVGLGGIGKTQVALSFAYDIFDTHPETSIFWIPALSMEMLESAVQDIAERLGIRASQNDKNITKLVRDHLSTPAAGKWLLIIDNADDINMLDGSATTDGLLRFPPQSSLGATIFTTRTSAVAQRLAGSNVLEMNKLEQSEADALLDKALIRGRMSSDRTITTELLAELDHLPLAITQAAAYININHISISDYLRLLRSTVEDAECLMSLELPDSTRYEQSASAIATTWVVTFRQIFQRDPIAAELLQYISCIEWKAIPHSILPQAQPEARMISAIGTLCSYSFLSKRADGMTYDMHRLVHLATRIWLQRENSFDETLTKMALHVKLVFPSNDWENREIWRAYLSHVAQIRRQWASVSVDPGAFALTRSELACAAGLCLLADGRTTEALDWMKESCHMSSGLAVDHPWRLTSQRYLAMMYSSEYQTEDAVRLLRHVVTIQEGSGLFSEDHPDRLTSQHMLASAYLENSQTKEAIELLEHVVTIRKRVLTEDHPYRLISQHMLASAYLENSQTKEAIELLEHVVTIRKRVLTEDHPYRLNSQGMLAVAYLRNSQTKEAIELLEHVVTIKKRVLAEDHPYRLTSQHQLASAYLQNSQTKEAIELFEHIVTIRKRVLAEDHPYRLASQYMLASAYLQNSQTKEAIELFEHVVTIKKRVLAEDHPHRLWSQDMLARAYAANRQLT